MELLSLSTLYSWQASDFNCAGGYDPECEREGIAAELMAWLCWRIPAEGKGEAKAETWLRVQRRAEEQYLISQNISQIGTLTSNVVNYVHSTKPSPEHSINTSSQSLPPHIPTPKPHTLFFQSLYPLNASISTTSFTASVVNTNGPSSCTTILSSIRIPIPRKASGQRSSLGT